MPDTITFDEGLRIVTVESYGTITAEDQSVTLASVLRIHKEQKVSRVLVNATKTTSHPSTLAIFNFALEAAKQLGGLRVAIAAPPGELDGPMFFETVARNRMANVRVFNSRDDALAWLTSEPNQEPKAPRY